MTTAALRPSLQMWGPRHAVTLAQARRRTDFVRLMRFVFSAGAAISAGTLFGYLINHSITGEAVRYEQTTSVVTMLNPRFTGRDADDRPYVITAETARRRRENPDLIDLVRPHLEGEPKLTVDAVDGVFDNKAQVLDLAGEVVLVDSSGYTFTTERARMYVRENRVEGATPLRGVGAIGEVRGDAYEVLDGGNRIVLKGRVWSRFEAEETKPDRAGRAE